MGVVPQKYKHAGVHAEKSALLATFLSSVWHISPKFGPFFFVIVRSKPFPLGIFATLIFGTAHFFYDGGDVENSFTLLLSLSLLSLPLFLSFGQVSPTPFDRSVGAPLQSFPPNDEDL